ncbi:ScyD/ScyE family protein [Actinocrispum sp. NPDC049592]|uniref:ScyD/ScyE family protein n=1 Tax=Actinocrispum sp. NPDC049592 TaxID=3154835 RepID=UPI00344A87A4
MSAARGSRAAAVVMGAVVVASVVVPGTALAGGGSHHGIETIASGLNSPRGLAFGPDGDLYVAEGGFGGAAPCFAGAEGPTCFGRSGSITKVSHGKQSRVLDGLPSTAHPDGANGTGPADVVVDGKSLVFTVGLGADPAIRETLSAPDLGVLRKADKHGHLSTLGDLAGYEASANPDGVTPPDSNPTSVALTPWGTEVVTDAGGNDLVEVGHGGKIRTVAVFPAVNNAQAVPTSVIRGRDGAFYVGQLTGFPFVPGAAKVFKVWPSGRGEPEVVADGFTNIIDIAQTWDGSLYVLEIAKNGLLAGDGQGALIKVDRHGKKTTVLDTGLTMPGGLTIRGDDAYISNCGVCKGGGQVIRVPLH